MRLKALVVVPFALAPLAGCDLFGLVDQTLDIPIDLESPPQSFDLTGPVAEAEGSACSAADSAGCTALKAICNTGTDTSTCDTAPSMPDTFPAQITVGAETKDANELMADMGITDATQIEVGVPVDTTEQLADQGVQSPDAVKSVSIDAMSLAWKSNSLTFDAPPLDLYISGEDLGEGALDAQALIDAGAVTKIGTIGKDLDGDGTFDVGQVAGETGDVAVEFDANGKDALNEAVKSGTFTIVTAVTPGHGLTLKADPADATKVRKPTGAGEIALKATLVYQVSASDVVGGVQDATQ